MSKGSVRNLYNEIRCADEIRPPGRMKSPSAMKYFVCDKILRKGSALTCFEY